MNRSDQLDELGLSENTLVVFTSDNGAAKPRRTPSSESSKSAFLADGDTAGSNGALRGWKWHLYEGGVRVPLIVRWPGQVPSSRVDDSSVLHVNDFFPTLARLARAALPKGYQPDGVDVSPALAGTKYNRDQPIYWHHPTDNRRGPSLAIRDGDWKLLMEYDGSDVQLFDLSQDESESNDLAPMHPAIVDKLSEKLTRWHRSLPPRINRVYVEPVVSK
jgi:arylsulfatase A-like enzyme